MHHQDIHTIVSHLFNKPSLEEVATEDIEELISKYPYFAPARYMLAKKLYDKEALNAEDRLVTAGLYIHNPLRLHWLLNQSAETEVSTKTEEIVTITDTVEEDTTYEPEETPDEENTTASLITTEAPPPITDETPASPADSHASEETGHEATDHTSTPESSEQTEPDAVIPQTTKPHTTAAVTEGFPIAFQSYHTIDYFASQGIRLQAADLDRDKFGRQLKSFTEWLRSMKKLPATSPDGQEDDNNHRHVVLKAAYSLAEREIVTEAMAEVWAKQGNRQKAIDIYHKLSLQNPAKSGYFAAKIDILKAL